MGLYAGALRGLSENMLRRRQQEEALRDAIAGVALQNALNPDLDPAVRSQFAAMLKGTPYERIASVQIPETPERKLRRTLDPIVAGAGAATTLGGAGLLTPEIAQTIETITGQKFFPRTPAMPAQVEDLPKPPPGMAGLEAPRRGQVLPTEQVTVAPGRPEQIDVSRFQPKQLTVEIPGVGRMSAKEAAEIIGTEGMRKLLIPGSGLRVNVPGVGWMDAEEAAKIIGPEGVRSLLGIAAPPTPGQVLDQKKAALQQQAIQRYSEVLQQTGDPAKAWVAAGAIDPVTFKPDLPSQPDPIRQQEYRLRVQATNEFVSTRQAALDRGASIDEANRVAYEQAIAVDPSYPAPATLVRPEAPAGPREQVWAKFFSGAQLNAQEQQFISNELKGDTELSNAFQVLSRYASIAPNKRTAEENRLYDRALDVVSGKLGIPAEELQSKPPTFWDRVKLFTGRMPQPKPGAPISAEQWVSQQMNAIRNRGARTQRDYQRIFNQARKAPGADKVPLTYWRALQKAILAMK